MGNRNDRLDDEVAVAPQQPLVEVQIGPRNHFGLYACPLCNVLGFTTRRTLKIHMTKKHPQTDVAARARRVLVGGRERLGCRVCRKSFLTPRKLRDHMATSHPAPHLAAVCPEPECGRRFKSPFHLNKHMKQVHPRGPPVSCDMCHKVYKTEGLLKKHASRMHAAVADNID